NNSADYATVKYDTDGHQIWVARYDGPAHYDDYPAALAVDAKGNVYVTGSSFNTGSSYQDFATVKYDPGGKQLWVARYAGAGNGAVPTAIAVDDAGEVYVTGFSNDPDADIESDYVTLKYDTDGNRLWYAIYPGPFYYRPVGARSIAVDGSG